MKQIITIGREFGSGGRELGCRLAEELKIAYYDQEVISEIAKRTEFSEEYVHQIVEHKPITPFPIHIGTSFSPAVNPMILQSQSIYQEQSRIIREMAGKSDCVIVGRCADYILRDEKPFRFFVYADMESRISRCREKASSQEQILIALPFYMLQYEFQSYFAAAEKPQTGLGVTIASGLTNMILDALFMAFFHWGVVGAAAATAVSQAVGGTVPLIYFSRPNKSLLRLTKTKWDGKALLKACTNSTSELMSNISMSVVSMLYNVQLMKYAGENGVAAYGVLMYVNMIFLAAFIGYSVGTAPVTGYHYGAGNHTELKSLLKKSVCVISVFAVCMFLLAEILAHPLAKIFVGYDEVLLNLTHHGFTIFSFSFLFAGFSIYGSSFFTALNNGLISALISFLRTLVFQIAAVLILPAFLGIDGIWISIVAAEIMAVMITVFFVVKMRKRYHYL